MTASSGDGGGGGGGGGGVGGGGGGGGAKRAPLPFTDKPALERACRELGVHEVGWGVRAWGYSQYVWGAVSFLVGYLNISSSPLGLLWSIPLGWGFFALWMTGHDAHHDAIFWHARPRLNAVVAFVCTDLVAMSGSNWERVHHKEHHSYPNSSVDSQRLLGGWFLPEVLHTLSIFAKYWRLDAADLLSARARPLDYLSFAWRSYMLLSLGPLPLLCTLFSTSVIMSYLGLLTHSSILSIPSKGYRQRQLQNTCDFLPGSYFAEVLFACLNTHAVHHVWPHLPRGLHGHAARELRLLEPTHYRSFDTWLDVWRFTRTRVNPPPHHRCPAPHEYYASASPSPPAASAASSSATAS